MSNKARGRKPLSKDEMNIMRERILKAARELFAKQGYNSISMRTLASVAEMSPTSLYRFYPNKRAILVHIWGEIFEQLFKACSKAVQDAGGRNADARKKGDDLLVDAAGLLGYLADAQRDHRVEEPTDRRGGIPR